ncbi:MAG: hypothetical protein H6867_08250 [Rhodospirillales bacterium]|nr:hypothetical protein [Rhodospirillales bacterium]MCB9995547.1 hypothetical protein [Rhodospirillales bacterium]
MYQHLADILKHPKDRPTRNYTLGEAFQHYAKGKNWDSIDDNRLNFTRAGRACERVHTCGGALISTAVLLTSIGSGGATLPLWLAATFAAVNMGAMKTAGVVMGKAMDMAIRTAHKRNPDHPDINPDNF